LDEVGLYANPPLFRRAVADRATGQERPASRGVDQGLCCEALAICVYGEWPVAMEVAHLMRLLRIHNGLETRVPERAVEIEARNAGCRGLNGKVQRTTVGENAGLRNPRRVLDDLACRAGQKFRQQAQRLTGNKLTADSMARIAAGFQQQNPCTGASSSDRGGTSAGPAADHDEVVGHCGFRASTPMRYRYCSCT